MGSEIRRIRLPADARGLRLVGIPQAEKSYIVQAFLDLPSAEAASATLADPRFVGEFSMYGIGRPPTPAQASQRFVANFTFAPRHLDRLRTPGEHDLVLVAEAADMADEFRYDALRVEHTAPS